MGSALGLNAERARAQLAASGFAAARARVRRAASLHYQGQTFELTVPAPGGPMDAAAVAALGEAFAAEHERTYGHRAGPDEPVELVNIQVAGQGVAERSRVPDLIRPGARAELDGYGNIVVTL